MEKLKQLMATRSGAAKLSFAAVAVAYGLKALLANKPSKSKDSGQHNESFSKRKARVAVDGVFYKRIKLLLKIVLPSIHSKEAFLLILHTLFLISRTLATIYITKLDGQISKTIVQRDAKGFIKYLSWWLLSALPISYINSMIRFLESKLGIAFRSRLVNHCYKMYMKDDTYYRVSNLDSRLSNPDQCLTEDVSKWCEDISHLYSQLSKPMLDISLIVYTLATLPSQAPSAAAAAKSGTGRFSSFIMGVSMVCLTGGILRMFTPPFGKLVAEQARLYGELRAAHSRLITHSEEIAFYGGHEVEESILNRSYHSLVSHMNVIFKTRIGYTMLEQFLMKYMWSACGLVMISLPVFTASEDALTSSAATENRLGDRSANLVTARGLLTNAADAIERIMSSWKEVTELAGRTQRVTQLLDVFEDMTQKKFQKAGRIESDTEVVSEEDEESVLIDLSPEQQAEAKAEGLVVRRKQERWTKGRDGIVIDGKAYIELQNVPIVTPTGDILINEPGVSITVNPGMHLLITGPNGCGKSSLFRMIGGLWPVFSGVMVKPKQGDMFYIPQRPYLTNGNLLEQFIYPDTREDFEQKQRTYPEMEEILRIVDLRHVVEREGGWRSTKNWIDVLSGGEKQRVGMARLFYHKPKFAILDECTSAVSIDVEGRMYTAAKDGGITLMTVTHRPTLWKYHTHLMQFDGQGGYQFSELNVTTRLSFEEERKKIEKQLKDVPKLQDRLQYLCSALGDDSDFTASAVAREHRRASLGKSNSKKSLKL